MAKKCCFINGCDTIYGQGFFRPNEKVLEKWQTIIGKRGLTTGSRVCFKHFHEQDIVKGITILTEFHPFKRWKLNKEAVPALHLESKKQSKSKGNLKTKSKVFSNKKTLDVCSVPNCYHYKELNTGPGLKIFHDFPLEQCMLNRWVKVLDNVNWIPSDGKWKVCSAHFKPEDYEETDSKVLKITAIPSVNMNLKAVLTKPNPLDIDSEDERNLSSLNEDNSIQSRKRLSKASKVSTELNPLPINLEEESNPRATPSSNEDSLIQPPRKRFSNVIIVDLIKENKKSKFSGQSQSTALSAVENGCSVCLEKDKNVREVEFQLALAKEELQGQKKLLEEQKQLLDEQKKLLEEERNLVDEQKKLIEEQKKLLDKFKNNAQT